MVSMKKILAMISVGSFSIITSNNVIACSCSAQAKNNDLTTSFNKNNQLNFSATSVASFGLTVTNPTTETYDFDWTVVSNETLQSTIIPISNSVPVQLVAKATTNNAPSIAAGPNGQKVASVSTKSSIISFNATNNIVTIPLLLTLFTSDGTQWVSQKQVMDINVNVVIQDISDSLSLNDLAINPLQLDANINDTYQSLNSNQVIIDTIIAAFHQIKSVSQPQVAVDFKISNNQNDDDKQAVGTTVIITVAAVSTSTIITPDSQTTFDVTLIPPRQTIDLQNVMIANIDLEVNEQKTYADLNTNDSVIKTIAAAIVNYQAQANAQWNIDYTISNNQNPNDLQVNDTKVLMTVKATNNSSILLANSQTTFTVTLTAASETVNLTNITVNDPIITANPGNDYSKLNSNQYIIQAVIDAVNNYRSETNPQVNVDFTITNNQNPTEKQNKDVAVTFTVTATSASKLLTPNSLQTFIFTLVDSVNLNHVKVVGIPYVAAKSDQTYQQLNNNHTVIDAVIQAMKETKAGIEPSQITDFVISNDQDPAAAQTSKTKIKFTIKALESSKILMTNTEFSFILNLG